MPFSTAQAGRGHATFRNLLIIKYYFHKSVETWPKKAARDRTARDTFRSEREKTVLDGTYVIDIVRNNWKNDDPRLR